MTEPRNLAAPHEHPWAEDEEGRCVLCGIQYDTERLERHMRGMAALIDRYRAALQEIHEKPESRQKAWRVATEALGLPTDNEETDAT